MPGIHQVRVINTIGGDFFRVSGNVAQGDYVTIGSITYEWRYSGRVSGSHTKITMSVAGPWAAAVAIAALITTLNADAACPAWAAAVGDGSYVSLIPRRVSTDVVALAVSGANLARSGATMTGAIVEDDVIMLARVRRIASGDATMLGTALGTAKIPLFSIAGCENAPDTILLRATTAAGVVINIGTATVAWTQVAPDVWTLYYTEPIAAPLLAATDIVYGFLGISYP